MRHAKVELELGHLSPGGNALDHASSQQDSSIGDCGSLLVVDRDPKLLRTLKFILEEQGHTVTAAKSGEEALAVLHTNEFDLVLTDITLAEMSGIQLLTFMKTDMLWREIPVIILSGVNEPNTAARCVQAGAEDYLAKPVDPVLLQARVTTCLEKKRLRQLEQGYLSQLQVEQEKSERLLLNILPAPIAERLKAGESTIADHFPAVTVLFADIAGFTKLAAQISPVELVKSLNEIFSAFDRLAEKHDLEKIKTIGDAYMIVGGLPTPRLDHAEAVADMALDMQNEIRIFNSSHGTKLSIRIGMHSGAVVAGVIGQKKFSYDLWGDTVNTANRMETYGQAGHIQVTDTTHQLLKDTFTFSKRSKLNVKGKGDMITYLLTGRRA
ncbi:MAG: response regulator [Verrucomicrobia bacterium]|nr:response regulator [Verrucomicrobiota bacterium]